MHREQMADAFLTLQATWIFQFIPRMIHDATYD